MIKQSSKNFTFQLLRKWGKLFSVRLDFANGQMAFCTLLLLFANCNMLSNVWERKKKTSPEKNRGKSYTSNGIDKQTIPDYCLKLGKLDFCYTSNWICMYSKTLYIRGIKQAARQMHLCDPQTFQKLTK